MPRLEVTPMNPSILIFAGSTRTNSINKWLARQATETAQHMGINASFADLKDYPMPLYNGDLEQEQGPPKNAKALEALLKKYDGIIIASPEYNGAFSPLLKNTIDWVTRVERYAFAKKPIGLMSATPGKGGGVRGLKVLHLWLEHMRIKVVKEQFSLPQAPQAITEKGTLAEDKQVKLAEFIKHVSQTISKQQLAAA